jgi:hypothetical protein
MTWKLQVAYREPYRYFEGDRFQTFAFETYDVGHTEWKDPRSGTLMEFVATVDLAPMAARRAHFSALGGFHEGFSAKGEPGPGLGIELSARAWLAGCAALSDIPLSDAAIYPPDISTADLYSTRVYTNDFPQRTGGGLSVWWDMRISGMRRPWS